MDQNVPNRPIKLIELLLTAILGGAFAGFVIGAFIWMIEQGEKFLWSDLPSHFGIDPYKSWWLFAIPIAGGVLVGLGQIVFGNYPRPIDESVATLKAGGRIEPETVPKSGFNSLIALITGGPVGFEAAITSVLGGTATWVGRRISSVGELVNEAWDTKGVEGVPRALHQLPYWLAALAGLFTYRWLPFGGIDLGFRFADFNGGLTVGQGLGAFAMALVVIVPAAWAIQGARSAEKATFYRRSPILIAVAGAIIFALMAVPDHLVLFSGQEGIQMLPDASNGILAYVTIAKWLALIVAFLAGWRGGPIFPTYTAVAAFAVLVTNLLGASPHVYMVAAITAVSIVFVKGSVPLAFILTLYPVPLSYAAVILIGCVGGAVALAVARSAGVLPAEPGPDLPEVAPDSGASP